MLLLCFIIFDCVSAQYNTLQVVKLQGLERTRRSVYDIMPTRTLGNQKPPKELTARVICPCQEKDSGCVLDQHVPCRTILNILPGKDGVHSRLKKRHWRRKLRKLFAKWIHQKLNLKMLRLGLGSGKTLVIFIPAFIVAK